MGKVTKVSKTPTAPPPGVDPLVWHMRRDDFYDTRHLAGPVRSGPSARLIAAKHGSFIHDEGVLLGITIVMAIFATMWVLGTLLWAFR